MSGIINASFFFNISTSGLNAFIYPSDPFVEYMEITVLLHVSDHVGGN